MSRYSFIAYIADSLAFRGFHDIPTILLIRIIGLNMYQSKKATSGRVILSEAKDFVRQAEMLRCTQHDNTLAFLPRWQDESIPACHPELSKASCSGSGCFTTYSATVNDSELLTVAHVPQDVAPV